MQVLVPRGLGRLALTRPAQHGTNFSRDSSIGSYEAISGHSMLEEIACTSHARVCVSGFECARTSPCVAHARVCVGVVSDLKVIAYAHPFLVLRLEINRLQVKHAVN
eukprot:6173251-Pleurochrysis_carterae.AAC.1